MLSIWEFYLIGFCKHILQCFLAADLPWTRRTDEDIFLIYTKILPTTNVILKKNIKNNKTTCICTYTYINTSMHLLPKT